MVRYRAELAIIAIAVLFPILFRPSTSMLTLLNLAGVNAIVAVGYNLLLGYAGQISLGHSAFVGIGAYLTALLSKNVRLPFPLVLCVVAAACGLFGAFLGLPALRLEGNYLAIATLGFGVACQHVFMEWESVTGGFSGIRNIPPPTVFGFALRDRLHIYYLILAFVILAVACASTLIKTKPGRALMAVRDSETAALALGVEPGKTKTLAFAISAMYAGVAGGLYAYHFHQVYPHSFDLAMSLNILAMVVIGGLASVEGPLIGAGVITVVPEFLKEVRVQNASSILTGLLLIVCVTYYPAGLIQLYRALVTRLAQASGTRRRCLE